MVIGVDYGILTEELCRMHFDAMRDFAELGASMSVQGETGALLTLRLANRHMLSGEFVEKMGLTTGRVANILRRLEEKGLIERRSDREDGRHVLVALTAEGERQAEAQYEAFFTAHKNRLTWLGEEDAQALMRLLRRLLAYTREHPRPAE